VGVEPGVDPGVEAVLQVGHDPGPVAGAVAPDLDVAEVDGLHGAVAVVPAVALGVAVVEAAATVVVGTVEDRVHAFRLVTGGGAGGVVVAVAGTGRHEHAVRLVAVDRDRCRGRVRQVVVSTGRRPGEPAGRCLGEVVTPAGLVVDDRDEARRVGTERVLRGGVGVTAGAQHTDVPGGVVGRAADLVEG